MLIRSQDKTSIVNLRNVYAIYRVAKLKGKEIYETDIRCSNGLKETEGMLGTYSTEEKEIKVLDMIQKNYCRATELNHDINANILFCVPKNIVFQMPQDEEVEV